MPIKRRISKARDDRITAEAIDAFSRAIKLEASGKHQDKGEHGIHMSEPYRQAAMDLYFAIGQKPWEDSPLDVDDTGAAPEWCNGDRKQYWGESAKASPRTDGRYPMSGANRMRKLRAQRREDPGYMVAQVPVDTETVEALIAAKFVDREHEENRVEVGKGLARLIKIVVWQNIENISLRDE